MTSHKPTWLCGLNFVVCELRLKECLLVRIGGFPGGSVVKDPPAHAGDEGLVPGSGRSPGGGNGNHSSVLARRIPWTEEPGSYSPWGLKESDRAE